MTADDLVARVLTFLAADEERLERFLDCTGIDLGTIRQVAKSPVFHEAVLDYVLDDDEVRKLFVFATGISAKSVASVRMIANPPPRPRDEGEQG